MKIAVFAGHGRNSSGKPDPGAVNTDLDLQEHVAADAITRALCDQLKLAGHMPYTLPPPLSLKAKTQAVNSIHSEAGLDLALEVHFNSAKSSKAHGTEVWHWPGPGVVTAASVSSTICRALATFDRGPKESQNLYWLRKTVPRSILVEILFISSPEEAAKILEPGFSEAAAAAIFHGILEAQ